MFLAVSTEVEISMSSPYVSATSVTYHFKFLPSKIVGSNGKIVITFPDNYIAVHDDFNTDAVCAGLTPSNAVDGLDEAYVTAFRTLTIQNFLEFRPD